LSLALGKKNGSGTTEPDPFFFYGWGKQAVKFAEENGATDGQVHAVIKAMTDKGYHLTK
jgi:hypothetical protein